MQDLRLIGPHEDGRHLLLTGADGQRYRLAITEELREAVRRRPVTPRREAPTLPPREIQARIRGGLTAQQIADDSGLDVERIRRFEGPVLAEREHVCDLARAIVLEPPRGDRPEQSLGEVVHERLVLRGVSTAGAVWDSWRREDGSWTVQLAFHAGSKDRNAQWEFDLARRVIVADNDEARWLTEAAPAAGQPASGSSRGIYDVESDGGVRLRDEPGGTAEAGDEPLASVIALYGTPRQKPTTDEILAALSDRRGQRGPVGPAELDDDDEDGLFDGLNPSGVSAAHPAASHPQDAPDDTVLPAPRGDRGATAPEDATEDEPEDHGTEHRQQSGDRDRDRPARARRNRSRRVSVPSWDEIVFGPRKD